MVDSRETGLLLRAARGSNMSLFRKKSIVARDWCAIELMEAEAFIIRRLCD